MGILVSVFMSGTSYLASLVISAVYFCRFSKIFACLSKAQNANSTP